MKIIIILVVALSCSVGCLAKPLSDEEMEAMFINILNTCKEKEGASDADVATVVAKGVAQSPEGRCMQTCLMESAGIIQNDRLSVDGVLERAAVLTNNDAASMEKARAIANECQNPSVENSCDRGPKMVECVEVVGQRLGVDPKTMM